MILRQKLQIYLHELLACDAFTDYAPNGLQVQGYEKIRAICTAVTASMEVIKAASAFQADALLVHHGYFWRGEDPIIAGIKHGRIAELMRNDMNLFAYHLPLDCYLEWGNNACLGQLLDLQSIAQHPAGNIPNVLWSGAFSEPKLATDVCALLKEKLHRVPLHIAGTTKPIKRIAWCSGAAQDYIEEAHALGVDAFLSGEVSERTYHQAHELGIHYFSAGHHATERYGIQALGKHLAKEFGLQHHFIDSDNPV